VKRGEGVGGVREVMGRGEEGGEGEEGSCPTSKFRLNVRVRQAHVSYVNVIYDGVYCSRHPTGPCL
jgi:hypothetical protein